MKRTRITLAATALLVTTLAIACNKTGDTSRITVQNISNNGCIYHTDHASLVEKDQDFSTDSIGYSYSHGTLYITHYNLLLNCAFEAGGIDVDIVTEGNTITIREYEHDGPIADCICFTDNSFQIANLPHGTYTLVFLSCYPEPYRVTITV
ncbi:MAG: hypothetical protein IJL48_11875 [Bacteroidales bacterium]|nr:hypothetical protein [Bacteroidales bacterium]